MLSSFTLSLEGQLGPAPEPQCVRGVSAWSLEISLFLSRYGVGLVYFHSFTILVLLYNKPRGGLYSWLNVEWGVLRLLSR